MRSLKPLALVAAVALGCGAHESFTPTERVEGVTVEGYREAFYDLASEEGAPQGTVKVWSRGAELVKTPRGKTTIIHVGLTVDNPRDEPIRIDLDRLRLESIQAAVPEPTDIPAVLVSGVPTIPPESSGTIEVTFTLPDGLRPKDIQAFRVRWTALTNGQKFTEFTPFAQYEEYIYVPVEAYYYPYYPWDYPYYGPWGYYYRRINLELRDEPYPRRVQVRGRPVEL